MKKLINNKNYYYDGRWQHKEYIITELLHNAFVIWKDSVAVKTVSSLDAAKNYIDTVLGE